VSFECGEFCEECWRKGSREFEEGDLCVYLFSFNEILRVCPLSNCGSKKISLAQFGVVVEVLQVFEWKKVCCYPTKRSRDSSDHHVL